MPNTPDGGPPIVIGGNSAPKPPTTPAPKNPPQQITKANMPAMSNKPGPLMQALSRGFQRMMRDEGPLAQYRHTLLNPGHSQTAFKPTDFKTGTMRNLATQYGAGSVDYRTGGPAHSTALAYFPPNQHEGTLARQFNDKVGTIFPANQHEGTLARQGREVSPATPGPVGGLHAALSAQISGGGHLPGGGMPAPNGGGGISGGGGQIPGGGGNTLADFIQQAQALVNAQYNPQLADLNALGAQDRNTFNDQRANTIADAQRMGNNLTQIYGDLGQKLGGLAGQVGAENQGVQQQVGDAYQKLQQQLAGDQFGTQQMRDLMTGLANVGGTNAEATLKGMGQNQTGLLQTEAANAPVMGANRVSATDVQELQTLRNLADNLQSQLNALQSKQVNIHSQEGQQVAALAQKLQQQAGAAQQAYNLKEQSLGIQQQRVDNSLALGQGRLGIDQQNADTRAQAERDKVAQDNVMNQLRREGLSISAQKAARTAAGSNPKGLLGAETLAQQLMPNHGSNLMEFFLQKNATPLAAAEQGAAGATTAQNLAQQWARANAGRLGTDPATLYNDLTMMIAAINGKLGNA